MSPLSACCFIVEVIPAGRKSVFLNRRANKRRVFKEEWWIYWVRLKKNPKTTAQIVLKQDKRSTPPSHFQPQNISHSILAWPLPGNTLLCLLFTLWVPTLNADCAERQLSADQQHACIHLPVLLSWSGNQGASLCSGCICFPPVSTRRRRSKAVMLFTSRYHTHICLLRSAADVPLTSIHAGRCWANVAFPRCFLHSHLWLITLQQSRDFQLLGISETASNIYNA